MTSHTVNKQLQLGTKKQEKKHREKHRETREIFFFKNYVENEAGGLVPDLILFFRKALFEIKASGLELSFKICR